MSANTKYVNPMVDVSFKRIFGTDPNKDLLIAFLNELFEGRKHIVDLVYNKNEHHGENKEEGSAVFDILCTGDKGEKFLIEVQKNRPINFKKRGLYYTSRLVSEQAPRGEMLKEWQYNVSEVYFVGILSEPIADCNRYIHDISMNYRGTTEIFDDEVGYIYIDLSKFVKKEEELKTNLDNWLFSLKHLNEMDDMPAHLQKTIFEKLYNIAEYSNMTKEEQEIYNQGLKRECDNAAVIAQKLLEGEEKGKVEEKKAIALEMKHEGYTIDQIVKLTKLTVEEIEKL